MTDSHLSRWTQWFRSDDERDSRLWVLAALLWLWLSMLLGTYLRTSFIEPAILVLPFKYCLHAHSHAAFFGWTGGMLMGLMYHLMPASGGPVTKQHGRLSMRRIHLVLLQICTLAAVIAFWLQGYGPVSIAFSTLSMGLWLLFLNEVRKARSAAQQSADTGVGSYCLAASSFLLLAALATGVLTYFTVRGPASPDIKNTLVEAFLHIYSEGWLMLGAMGLVLAIVSRNRRLRDREQALLRVHLYLYVPLIVLSAFRLASPEVLPTLLIDSSRFAGLLIALLHCGFIAISGVYRLGPAGKIVALFLGAKAVMEIVPVLPGASALLAYRAIPVSYMHGKLLALISFVFLWAACTFTARSASLSLGRLRGPLITFAVSAAGMTLMLIVSAAPVIAHWLHLPLSGGGAWLYSLGQYGAVAAGVVLLVGTLQCALRIAENRMPLPSALLRRP